MRLRRGLWLIAVLLLTALGSCQKGGQGSGLLPAPADLRAVSAAADQIELQWGVVEGATGYNLYSSSSETGTYTKVNTDALTSTAHTVTGLAPEAAYWYKVAAVKGKREQALSGPLAVSTARTAPGVGAGGRVVYVAGYAMPSAGRRQASYWRDGERVDLSTSSSAARSIVVTGQDVYVAGYDDNDGQVPCYWKNGERVELASVYKGYIKGEARAIAVARGSVYVSGGVVTRIEDAGGENVGAIEFWVPCYWKNGKRVDLAQESGFGASSDAIVVSGSDLYLTVPGASYWKNGARVALSTRGKDWSGYADSLFVSGSDVYAAGAVATGPTNEAWVHCYWKNGERVELEKGAITRSMYVAAGDVYVAGYSERGPCYWRNGTRVDLDPSAGSGEAYSIFVAGSDVYVAGSIKDPSRLLLPCLWVNGRRVDLDGGNGEAYSVFAVSAGTEVVTRDPARADELNSRGMELYKAGSYEEAEALFREAVEADPEHKRAHYNLACMIALQLAGSAEELRGQAEDPSSRVSEVRRELERAIELDPEAAPNALKDSDLARLRVAGLIERWIGK